MPTTTIPPFGSPLSHKFPQSIPLPPKPYDAVIDTAFHDAYASCVHHEAYAHSVQHEANATSNVTSNDDALRLIWPRLLGFLILEAPTDVGRNAMAGEILECQGDPEKMDALARFYMDHLIRSDQPDRQHFHPLMTRTRSKNTAAQSPSSRVRSSLNHEIIKLLRDPPSHATITAACSQAISIHFPTRNRFGALCSEKESHAELSSAEKESSLNLPLGHTYYTASQCRKTHFCYIIPPLTPGPGREDDDVVVVARDQDQDGTLTRDQDGTLTRDQDGTLIHDQDGTVTPSHRNMVPTAFAGRAWAALQNFAGPMIIDVLGELGGDKVHRLQNRMTLDAGMHGLFDEMAFWFEEFQRPNVSKLPPTPIPISRRAYWEAVKRSPSIRLGPPSIRLGLSPYLYLTLDT
ncbi:hypothetical protein CC2G_013490 [Coprinopsis cinerea AmutBmut pab1-1]|nr:hypothetical protein CC2G_013490 [Coprinopsis cinerea AmutBmut pab1-1]